MVKATLMIALLYFLSPIAIASIQSIQAKSMNTESPRQEFFKPAAAVTQVATLQASEKMPEPVQTLCSGIEVNSESPVSFCEGFVAEPMMTLNDLESSGFYACEQMVQPEIHFQPELDMTEISKLVSQMTIAKNN